MALLGACKAGVFECVSDEQCEAGVCQASGYCSFPDGDCPSGQRYGEFAPGELAGACVPDGSDEAAATEDTLTDSNATTTSDSGPLDSTSAGLDDSGDTTTSPGSTGGAASTDDGVASTNPDTESTGSTGAPEVCPALVDDFEDGVIARYWIPDYPEFTSEIGGRMVFTIDPPQAPYPDVTLDSAYDLSNGWFRAELGDLVPSPLVQSYTRLNNANAEDEYVSVLIEGNELIARHGLEGPGFINLTTTNFDPDAHRWVQLRGDGDTVYFETSFDGVTFESFASAPSPFSLTAVTPGIGSGNWASIPAEVIVSFESVALCTDDTLN